MATTESTATSEPEEHPRRRRGRGLVAGLSLCALAATGVLGAAHVESLLRDDSPALHAAAADTAAVAALPQVDTPPSGREIGPTEPLDSVPAEDVAGLTTGTAARVGSGVRATPAVRAQRAAEARASRAAARAMLGATPGFSRPVEGTHKTSGFGPRWGRIHKGVDFAGPVGLPVRAVAAGTVTIAEVQSGYGNLVEVQHADGGFTRYGHLDKIRVKVGEKVDAAHIIGALGNTGRSTGPHLHFEVRSPAGTPYDPSPWLQRHGITPADVEPTP